MVTLQFSWRIKIFGFLVTMIALESRVSASENFITKWEFTKLCQFGYDPQTDISTFPLSRQPGGLTLDPLAVKKGDAIFLRARNVENFFKEIDPLIKESYIIIAHGEYKDGFKESYLPYLENPKIIAWFGTHPCAKPHPKFSAIPLGIFPSNEQNDYKHKMKMRKVLKKIKHMKKNKLAYVNFEVKSHPERPLLKKKLQERSFSYFGKKKPFFDYLKEMAQCKFTFSPRGYGIDCYRTWEALLVGSIPIIKSSHLDCMYEGLPVLIVNDWSQIDEDFLNKKYQEMTSQTYDMSKLYIEYWHQKIATVRKNSL